MRRFEKNNPMNYSHKLLIIVALLSASINMNSQQAYEPVFETAVSIGLNAPRFMNDHPIDFLIPKDYRFRPRVGISLRYYPKTRFFAEYQLAFSPEGGGYKAAPTNLQFVKNSFSIGFDLLPKKETDWYLGVSYSLNGLINGKYEGNQIRDYYKAAYQGAALFSSVKTHLENTGYIEARLKAQLYSSDMLKAGHIKSRQLLLPVFEIAYGKQLNY
jgi:hypothetical protein